MRPALLVIAGPNGSGKTTVTVRLRAERWSEGVEYLTARREELLAAQQGIAFETVFSAPDKVEFLLRAKAAGYFVRVFFIGTSDPRINAARVADRVLRGGHTVPIEKIVARYDRSMTNLAAAIDIADRCYVYDNSIDGVEGRLCARTVKGTLRKIYGELPTWVEDAITPLEAHAEFVDLRVA